MLSLLRRHGVLGWALVVVLLVSMTGGAAWAAHEYLITSTTQISPKVLAQLRGSKGTAGRRGVAGPAGIQGPAGTGGQQGASGLNGTPGSPGTAGVAGATGPTGLQGATGETGPAGSAVAYAYVLTNGTIAGTASNITQSEITHPSTGFYCFNSLPFSVHVISVTIGSQTGSTLIGSGLPFFNGSCTGANQAHVVIETPLGVLTDGEFMITIN